MYTYKLDISSNNLSEIRELFRKIRKCVKEGRSSLNRGGGQAGILALCQDVAMLYSLRKSHHVCM